MFRPSLKEKFDDEQFLSTDFATVIEDDKETLAHLKLRKSKPTLSGPFSLNVNHYFQRIFKELDSTDSRLQKLESGD